MTDQGERFKRMIVRLPFDAVDYSSVAFAARFADLLHLDLVGMFAENELAQLTHLSGVREFRATGGGWQLIDAAQIEQHVARAAAEARSLFRRASKIGGRAGTFNLAGTLSDRVTEREFTTDGIIIAVIEPRNAVERITHQFTSLMDSTLKTGAAALLVPSRVARTAGPVVAVMSDPHDPSIAAAVTVASATGERLIVFAPRGADREAEREFEAEIASAQIELRVLPGDTNTPAEFAAALSLINERLMVLSRGVQNVREWTKLASCRGVPVLVTGASSRDLDPHT